ncbi:MAG: DUF1508 domain-containing protein [Bacteroidota bacterium]
MRVRLYKKTKDNLSYFQFIADDDQVVLNSQGYTGKDDRNGGVRSVVNNAGNADRYDRQSEDGTHFFLLKAGNGQEIARSVTYGSEAEMEAAIAICIAEIPGIAGSGKAAPAAPAETAGTEAANPYAGDRDGDDNYKPLSFYQSRISGVENGFDTFATEDGANFYFTLNRGGYIILISESYTSQSGRNNGVESVTNNLPIPERYQRMVHPNGKFYFNLLAGNNQEIATSIWFDAEGGRETAISALLAMRFGEGSGELEAMEAGYQASVTIDEAPAVRETDEPKKKRKKRVKKEPKGEKILLKSGGYLFNDVTYQTMKSANDKYYFSFRTSDGKAILLNANVRGYNSEEEVDEAVQRIIEFGPTEANYQGKTTKNGKYYFYLKDADGNNIGKSFFYDTPEDMQAAIGLLVGQIGAVAETPGGTAGVLDDYLPCDRYAGEAGFHRFFNAQGEEWYFGFNGNDGKTFLRSEGYTTEAARDNGIASVIKNAPLEERWKMIEENGEFFYALRAGNHQEIARSCPYGDAAARDAAWAWVTGPDSTIGFGSVDRDGVRWSVAMIRKEEEEAAARQRREAEAAAAEAAKRKDDDYLACKVYESHLGDVSEKYPGFITFEEEGEYYFAWVEDGKIVLRSEGYTTESARNNGIESVMKNREIEERFSFDEKMGYYFLVLKAGNHQEIGRGCPEKDAAAVMFWFPSARASRLAAAAPPKPERKDDDYLACKVYESHLEDISEKYPGFITFEEEGEYYFAWVEDGKIVLRSEGYTTESARNNGIESVMKNREIEERFSVDEKMGYYFLVLKAGNHQEIGRGCPEKDRGAVVGWFPSGMAAGAAAKLAAAAVLLVPAVTPEEKEDDYLPCSAYAGHNVTDAANRVALFETDGQYYFVIYNEDGGVRLRSEGFETTTNRDDELGAALRHLDNQEMYHTLEWGKYRLHILKDENGREVGRSCLERIPVAVIPPAEREDDYLKCEEYEGHKVNDKQNNVAFFKHENGQFYFAVYDNDGKVRIRSEGFRDAKERDVELSGVLKNIDNEEMYEEIRKGKYRIRVLKDKTGREVGRSCLEKDEVAAAVPLAGAGAAAAAAAVAATAATPPPPPPKTTPPPPPPPPPTPKPTPPPPPPPPVEKAGGFRWWWLLPLLLIPLLWFLFKDCSGCGAAAPPPPPIEEPAVTTPPADTVKEKVPPPPPPPPTCDCGAFASAVFPNISTDKAKSLKRLGTYPEFGNSHSLDAAGFYNKLKDRHAASRTDRTFLDKVFKAMGYTNGFSDATADMFSSVTLTPGTDGYMGYGVGHQTVYASLDTKGQDLEAFRIEAANGCTMHFMKTCGNHFFFCSN